MGWGEPLLRNGMGISQKVVSTCISLAFLSIIIIMIMIIIIILFAFSVLLNCHYLIPQAFIFLFFFFNYFHDSLLRTPVRIGWAISQWLCGA